MPSQSTESAYLARLQFNPKLLKGVVSWYLTNVRLSSLLILVILLVGVTSLINLPKRLNPEVKIPIVSISAVLPGASPSEVESLLTIPIEQAIDDLEGLSEYGSISQENVSSISLQFESGISSEDAERDVQTAMSKITNLPENATSPTVQSLDFENQPVLTMAISSTTVDLSSLNQVTQDLKKNLEAQSLIDHVELVGSAKPDIQIEIDQALISSGIVNPISLSQQLTSSLKSFPLGSLTTTSNTIPVSINKTINSLTDIRNLPYRLNDNSTVLLGNIVSIQEVAAPQASHLGFLMLPGDQEPRHAVTMAVYKSSTADITKTAQLALEKSEEFLSLRSLDGYQVTTITNVAGEIDKQFNELFVNFSQTIALVFLTLLLFLGLRQSTVVALSMPLTLLITFSVMYATGISLNFLSVFSLLIALGLLVDDAIVIVSAITTYYKSGKFTATQTGLLVWQDFIVPIWSTTITTVWAFVPLLLATGIIGEFIKTIPIVVSASLLASTSVAVLITLPLSIVIFKGSIAQRVRIVIWITVIAIPLGVYLLLVPRNPFWLYGLSLVLIILFLTTLYRTRAIHQQRILNYSKKFTWLSRILDQGVFDLQRLSKHYYAIMMYILDRKVSRRQVIAGVILFSLFSYSLVPLGLVVNEFFPKTPGNSLSLFIELPEGTNLATTSQVARDVLVDAIDESSDIAVATLEIGKRPESDGFGRVGGENVAVITLRLVEESVRQSNTIELASSLRASFLPRYTAAKLSVIEPSSGPPAGADLQITLLGPESEILAQNASVLESYLADQSGVTNISRSITPSIGKLAFKINPLLAQLNQVSIDQAGYFGRLYLSGITLASTTLDNEEIDLLLRLNSPLSPSDVPSLMIPTLTGNSVSLTKLGELAFESNPSLITRQDGQRSLSVSAGVEAGYSSTEINQELEKFANQIALPDGYRWQTGGINEENARSVQSIIQAMGLSAILILVTMVIQLGSFRKALIILLVIPPAISGVFIAFALTGTPLSFPALIGVLALFGIVVNNSIVVVEKINQNMKLGISFKESIADAAASRVEPIMLSSLTTIMGLIPITLIDPLWRGLGGAIIAGLTVSGSLMLLFIPILYYMWFQDEQPQSSTRIQ